MSRTLFIGDVHGCYDELIALTKKIWLTPDDHLYFAGDLINKWPQSIEVVEFVRNRPNTWCVLGNHEYFPLISYEEVEKIATESAHLSDGHKSWVYAQYDRSRELREEIEVRWHREWLTSLPHIIERDDFILVHAGLHPDHGLDTPLEIATLIRLVDGKPWYESYTGTKPVIYGHWAVDGLRIRPNTIGLDTWCCFGGHLTAYCLETREFWQVRANQISKMPEHWKNKISI
jgi:serine/threonine protein phosphatase 1